MVARKRFQVTAAIRPSDATTTPSSTALVTAEARRRGMSGCEQATNTNPGAKMPTVASSAPLHPWST